MYSSMAGIIPSLIVAGLVLILSWIALSHSAHYRSSGRLGSSYAIGAGAASFAVAFSVLNLAVQWHAINASLVAQELAKGVLVLRVISVTAAVTFVRLMLVGMQEEKFIIPASSLSGDYRGKDHKLSILLGSVSAICMVAGLLDNHFDHILPAPAPAELHSKSNIAMDLQ
jgi:hypothetical protein